MPKASSDMTRKECMEAMCHQCKIFNTYGTGDCERPLCPLYSFAPSAKMKAVTEPWKKIKNGAAVGFTGRGKNTKPGEIAAAAVTLYEWRFYGWAPEHVPPVLVAQYEEAKALLMSHEGGAGIVTEEPAEVIGDDTTGGRGW